MRSAEPCHGTRQKKHKATAHSAGLQEVWKVTAGPCNRARANNLAEFLSAILGQDANRYKIQNGMRGSRVKVGNKVRVSDQFGKAESSGMRKGQHS